MANIHLFLEAHKLTSELCFELLKPLLQIFVQGCNRFLGKLELRGCACLKAGNLGVRGGESGT